MTNEEAIVVLQKIKPIPYRGDSKSTTHILETIALDMAIKALEQQPCENAISRESVIEWLKDKDIIKTKNQEENARRELAEMPSVTPKPKIGKWNFIGYCMFECSSCGTPYTQEQLAYMRKYSYEEFSKHCPNCGARMTEVEK